MGRGIRVKPKRKTKTNAELKSNNKIELTKADIEKMKYEISKEATHKAVVLMLAYLMEEQPIDCDEDKIEDIFAGIDRYAQAIETHIISLKKVCEIIKEKTGITIGW